MNSPSFSIPMPPVKSPAKKMGIRMSGCERPLEDLLTQHVSACPINRTYIVIEIGSAGCTTLRAFKDIISEKRGLNPWIVFGFDLTEDKAWSLNWDEINAAFNGDPNILREEHCGLEESLFYTNRMYLWLLDDPRSFLWRPSDGLHGVPKGFSGSIDFAFIDGCHGACSGHDFEAIEKKVSIGGLVVFHDYGEIEQGTDFQPHCNEFINVRTYVHKLGLAAPCREPRKGWRFVGEIKGSRNFGGDGNSCAVIQRTEEPLEYQPLLQIDLGGAQG